MCKLKYVMDKCKDIAGSTMYPVGVELRHVRRLRWGHKCNKGPGTLWRMDLYDKLKPYSTAIGCYSGGFNCYVV